MNLSVVGVYPDNVDVWIVRPGLSANDDTPTLGLIVVRRNGEKVLLAVEPTQWNRVVRRLVVTIHDSSTELLESI